MLDLDKRDSEANRLVELLRSPAAKRFVIWTTLKMCALLFSIMAVIAIALRGSLNWSFTSYWLLQGIIGCCIGSLISLGAEYIGWALRNWAGSAGRFRSSA
jgi:FtsH-binding integral membrane protein